MKLTTMNWHDSAKRKLKLCERSSTVVCQQQKRPSTIAYGSAFARSKKARPRLSLPLLSRTVEVPDHAPVTVTGLPTIQPEVKKVRLKQSFVVFRLG